MLTSFLILVWLDRNLGGQCSQKGGRHRCTACKGPPPGASRCVFCRLVFPNPPLPSVNGNKGSRQKKLHPKNTIISKSHAFFALFFRFMDPPATNHLIPILCFLFQFVVFHNTDTHIYILSSTFALLIHNKLIKFCRFKNKPSPICPVTVIPRHRF
jgi:hypothetical protein